MWARPYGTWGIQAVEVTALHWRKHNLVKITRISFLFQFFQWRPERKDFLPQTTVPIHHLDSKRTCTSGSIPSGTGLWRWLARQEARRESSKGETASVRVRALQESCWWLYRWFAVVLPVSYVLHRTVLLLDLCPARFICDERQQTVESLLLFSLMHSPMTQDSHEGAWNSGFALVVSQHSICVFQSMAKLQPLRSRVQTFSTYLWSSLHRVYWIWKTQRREPVLLQIALLSNFLAPCSVTS